jgi:replicative DNA helicase
LKYWSAGDFYKTAHKIIFTAIETLYAKSEPVDLVTLSNRLREKGELEKIGGAAYLANGWWIPYPWRSMRATTHESFTTRPS